MTKDERRIIKAVNKWKKALNLNEWKIIFKMEELPEYGAETDLANVNYLEATMTFDPRTSWDDARIDNYVCHEMVHVLMGNLMKHEWDLEQNVGSAEQSAVRARWNSVVEQTTERLARLFEEMYNK